MAKSLAQFEAQTHQTDDSDLDNQLPKMPGPTQIFGQIRIWVTRSNWVEFGLDSKPTWPDPTRGHLYVKHPFYKEWVPCLSTPSERCVTFVLGGNEKGSSLFRSLVKSVACFLSIRKSRSKLFNPFIIISKMLFDGTQELAELESNRIHKNALTQPY